MAYNDTYRLAFHVKEYVARQLARDSGASIQCYDRNVTAIRFRVPVSSTRETYYEVRLIKLGTRKRI